MDLSAVILEPFDLRHLAKLHVAVAETCRAFGLPVEEMRVGYSAHGALGQRIVVHVVEEKEHFDPYLFLWDHEGFGAALSGFLEKVGGGEVEAATAWSVSRDRRTGHCRVKKGFLHKTKGEQQAEDSSPLERLAKRFRLPTELLVTLLEQPNTEWLELGSAPPPDAVETLAKRLEVAPLGDVPPRKEPGATFSFYVPEELCREAQALARRSQASLGELFVATWETAKAEVYATTPSINSFDDDAPAQLLPTPPVRLLAGWEVPATAAALADLPRSSEKALIQIVAPEPMVQEVRALALAADRAQSWVMVAAYDKARARLHASRRR